MPVFRVNRQKIVTEGVTTLQQIISDELQNYQICRAVGCDGIQSIKRNYGFHLFIELDYLDPNNRRVQEEITMLKTCDTIKLSDFPVLLNVENTLFSLAVVIAYVPGHYIAYCYRANGTWEKHNDIETKITRCKETLQINPHCALYLRSEI